MHLSTVKKQEEQEANLSTKKLKKVFCVSSFNFNFRILIFCRFHFYHFIWITNLEHWGFCHFELILLRCKTRHFHCRKCMFAYLFKISLKYSPKTFNKRQHLTYNSFLLSTHNVLFTWMSSFNWWIINSEQSNWCYWVKRFLCGVLLFLRFYKCSLWTHQQTFRYLIHSHST